MFFRKLFVVGAAILALGVAAGAAFAQTSEQRAMIVSAKAQGSVGEQADGYIGIREPGAVSAELRAAINETNSARRQEYVERAGRVGITPEEFGASLFETRLFPRITSGQWFRNSGGQWQQR